MKAEFLTFPFDMKTAHEDDFEGKGIIKGYASTFGNVDLGLDVVARGAFRKTLQESKGRHPVLADHNPSKQIGWNVRAREDQIGLKIESHLDVDNNALARERFSLARKGIELEIKVGLSIGFFTIKSEPDRDRPAIRILKELKLIEHSHVPFPMNTEAMVIGAKNLEMLNIIDPEILAEVKILIDNGRTKDEILETLQGAVYNELESDQNLLDSINTIGNFFNN